MRKTSAGWSKVSQAEAEEMVAEVIRDAVGHVRATVVVHTHGEAYGKTRAIEAMGEVIPESQQVLQELRG